MYPDCVFLDRVRVLSAELQQVAGDGDGEQGHLEGARFR
jgi:hypothetical protein